MTTPVSPDQLETMDETLQSVADGLRKLGVNPTILANACRIAQPQFLSYSLEARFSDEGEIAENFARQSSHVGGAAVVFDALECF